MCIIPYVDIYANKNGIYLFSTNTDLTNLNSDLKNYMPLTGGIIKGDLGASGSIRTAETLSASGAINGDSLITANTITAGTNIYANGMIQGKNGIGTNGTFAVMSNAANKISLIWTGTQLDVYIDSTRIGAVTLK